LFDVFLEHYDVFLHPCFFVHDRAVSREVIAGNKCLHSFYFYRLLADKMFCRVRDDKMQRYLNLQNNVFIDNIR
jgi:hypothetical protein